MDGLAAVTARMLDDSQLSAVSVIYRQAFPDHLRVPFAELAGTGPADELHVALDGDLPVGFAAVKLLASAGWVFLRYFAIAESRRRERLGQRLWQLLAESVVQAGWPERICFEVEDPAAAGDDSRERAVRSARVRFWASCGTAPLPVPGYVMPAITGTADPEPMLLMTPAEVASKVTADELERLVLAIYSQRYGLSRTDELIRRALESI